MRAIRIAAVLVVVVGVATAHKLGRSSSSAISRASRAR
jgi:hypothetical protein